MKRILVIFAIFGATLIQGAPEHYRPFDLFDAKAVKETIKKAAEEKVMQTLHETPIMENAKRVSEVNPEIAKRMVWKAKDNIVVLRAAAEGAVNKAVEMGIVEKADAPEQIKNMMNTPLVKKAASDVTMKHAVSMRIVEEPDHSDGENRHPASGSDHFPKRPNDPRTRSGYNFGMGGQRHMFPASSMRIVEEPENSPDPTENKNPNMEQDKMPGTQSKRAYNFGQRSATSSTMSFLNKVWEIIKPVAVTLTKDVLDGELTKPEKLVDVQFADRNWGVLVTALNEPKISNSAVKGATAAAKKMAVMRAAAAMDEVDGETAREIIESTAMMPAVQLAAAKRAIKTAVYYGLMPREAATPEVVMRVARLPAIKEAAAEGAFQSAVEMGVVPY